MAAPSRTREASNAGSISATVSTVAIALLALIGLALRGQRLSWQPLWWDEGYSLYFATEPLSRMAQLTALDIHPPLYYALLHSWLALLNNSGPAAARSFSVLAGVMAIPTMAWLANSLFPRRRRLVFIATLLLALNPMHLYYSQEVRMYGLALLLGMASTALFWALVRRPTAGRFVGYVLTAALGLYTLYYLAFLILGHALWGVWSQRHNRRRLAALAGAYGTLALLYLPWLLYAAPKLVTYVDDKVASDKDMPLNLGQYLWRHAVAFTGGHLVPTDPRLYFAALAGLFALLLLAVAGVFLMRQRRSANEPSVSPAAPAEELSTEPTPSPYGALWTFVLMPLACGFVLNQRLPFFPDGGERVLLFVLPYILILMAAAIDVTWRTYHLGKIALIALLVSAVAGVVVFFTMPRYVERDYRPIIHQIAQQGEEGDTYFAIFPWQVGYWRAYASQNNVGDDTAAAHTASPAPFLAGDSALTWNQGVSDALDAALARGTVWFPAPLSFGSTLPGEVEQHLAAQAVNLENRWHGAATRLSAWRRLERPVPMPLSANFGPVALTGAAVAAEDGSTRAASANESIAITLNWEPAGDAVALDQLYATIRLRDENGRVWAGRDYGPIGSMARISDTTGSETLGLTVPAGLAPDLYRVSVGVGISGTETLLYPAGLAAETDPLADIGEVAVIPPPNPQPISRLPIQIPLAPPEAREGIAFLGFSGIDPTDAHLAGTDLALTLFLQNRSVEPPARHLYVSLMADGEGVGGWEGWPLPSYPTESWTEGALVQTPVSLYLPAALESGAYELIAGLLDPETGEKSAPVALGSVTVKRRPAMFTRPAMQETVDPPVQFGGHARLLGYDLAADGDVLHLTLHWQALQTLLPAHHLFVHLDDGHGQTVVQDDGPPTTVAGRAPTGSWLPDEFISTVHAIPMPGDGVTDAEPMHFSVGLYNPDGNIRLPATIDGAPAGNAAEILLPR